MSGKSCEAGMARKSGPQGCQVSPCVRDTEYSFDCMQPSRRPQSLPSTILLPSRHLRTPSSQGCSQGALLSNGLVCYLWQPQGRHPDLKDPCWKHLVTRKLGPRLKPKEGSMWRTSQTCVLVEHFRSAAQVPLCPSRDSLYFRKNTCLF